MSFARNFAAGQQIAQTGLDAFDAARRKRDLGRVADAKPEELQGYTAEDGDQLAAMANAKDAQGNPYYTLEAREGGGYNARSNFQLQGADGAMVTPEVANTGIAPRKVTDFMGQRYEGALGARGLDNARAYAYADVISRDDPVRGLQMRRELANQDRDDQRFEHEKALQPMQRRATELGVKKGERDERAGERSDQLQIIDDQIAQMPEEALKVYASQVNTNSTDLPMLFIGKTKDGFQFLSRDPKTGEPGTKPMTYSTAQMRDLARVSIYASTGFGKESQTMLKETSKELYDMLYKDAQLAETTVRSGNDALGKQQGFDNDKARLALERQRVGIAASAASEARKSAGRPQWVAMEDGKGGVRYVDMNAVPSVGGVAQLPEGTRPARKPVDQRAAVDMAKTMVESGMADPDEPAKPLTMEKALALADARLSGQPYVSALEHLMQQYSEAKNKGPGAVGAPAGGVTYDPSLRAVVNEWAPALQENRGPGSVFQGVNAGLQKRTITGNN